MPSFVSLGQTTYLVESGETLVEVTLLRTGDLGDPVDVSFITNDFSAVAGEDYVAITDDSVVFPAVTTPGVTAQEVTVTVELLPDPEDSEQQSFSLTLINASGDGSLQAPRTGQIVLNADGGDGGVAPIDNLQVDFVPTVTDITRPIDIAFMPNDPSTMLVAQQPGIVSVVRDGEVLPTPLLDIRDITNFVQDRGLMSIAVHPDVEQNPYLYAAVVIDPPDVDRTERTATTNDDPDGRGSRYGQILQFDLDPATGYTTIIPGDAIGGAHQILLGGDADSITDVAFNGIHDYGSSRQTFGDADRFPATGADQPGADIIRIDSLSHAPGDLLFDAEGNLIITSGDGSVFNYADQRAVSVQDPTTLNGKILLVDPLTGEGLASNPFADASDGLDDNIDKVFQMGVRNPYRAALSPDGQLYFGDVGWSTLEEINQGPAGANFGWPYYEGGQFGVLEQTPVYQNFDSAGPFYEAVADGSIDVTAPLVAFYHEGIPDVPGFRANALMAGDFFQSGGPYPSFLDGFLLFGDIVSGRTFLLDPSNPSADPLFISDAAEFVVDWTTGPDGRMWFASLFTNTVGYLDISGSLPVPEVTNSIEFIDTAPFEDWDFNGFALASDGALQLTPATDFARGSVFFRDVLAIEADTSFTSEFRFELTGGDGTGGADGFAFVLQNSPDGSGALGEAGGFLGLGGLGAIANSLAISFDTFDNGSYDVSSNQIALILNGAVTAPTAMAALPTSVLDLNGGATGYAWIDYDGTIDLLEMFVDDGAVKPAAPVLSATVDLAGTVGSQAYAGFAGATGGFNNVQRILDWSLTSDGEVPPPPPSETTAIAFVDTAPVEEWAFNGAALLDTGALQLTPAADGQAGSVFYRAPLAVDADSSFTSTFRFALTDGDGTGGADGFAFVLQNDARGVDAVGVGGSKLGYSGSTKIFNSLAVTFDTFQNGANNDLSANQIGIFVNGNIKDTAAPRLALDPALFDLNSGAMGHVWIDYDGPSDLLEVFLAAGDTKPGTAALSSTVDLAGLVGDEAYAGFTAGTGGLNNAQRILDWTLATDGEVAPPPSPPSGTPTLAYAGFAGAAGLELNGAAAIDAATGNLRLTPALDGQAGSAFHTTALAIDPATSFTTEFDFQITDGDGLFGADGFTFVLQNDARGIDALGTGGSKLGYSGSIKIFNSLAIAFDTFQNSGQGDVSDNQIGIFVNGNVKAPLAQAEVDPFNLNGGATGHVWIDYDGTSDLLEVFLAAGDTKPEEAVLSTTVDLATFVGDEAYAGFTAGTGGLANAHDILDWSLTLDDPLVA